MFSNKQKNDFPKNLKIWKIRNFFENQIFEIIIFLEISIFSENFENVQIFNFLKFIARRAFV